MNEKSLKIRKIVSIGVFSALELVLYYIRFPLPIFPSFLQVQFSMIPLLICGFCYGYTVSLITLIIKTIIASLISMGESMAIGEMADMVIGIIVLFVTTFIYKKNKTKKNALISMIFGLLAWVISSALLNYFVLIPLYIKIYMKGNVDVFIGACSIIPGINNDNYKIMYVLLGAIPFNLLLSLCVFTITFFTYKKVSKFLKYRNNSEYTNNID